MQRPEAALARLLVVARDLHEALVQRQVVADRVLPTLLVLAVEREALHDELVDAVERHSLVLLTHDGHGDECNVAVRGFDHVLWILLRHGRLGRVHSIRMRRSGRHPSIRVGAVVRAHVRDRGIPAVAVVAITAVHHPHAQGSLLADGRRCRRHGRHGGGAESVRRRVPRLEAVVRGRLHGHGGQHRGDLLSPRRHRHRLFRRAETVDCRDCEQSATFLLHVHSLDLEPGP